MTYQPAQAEFGAIGPQATDHFAVIRSHWIDAFAEFEAAASACLARFAGTCVARNVPFSQRLSALASLEPSPHLSKKARDVLVEVAGSCQRLLIIRAAIVHSPMKEGERDGLPAALFNNAHDSAQKLPIYLIMTEVDFEDTRVELAQRTSSLEALLISPSSPPPPKPA